MEEYQENKLESHISEIKEENLVQESEIKADFDSNTTSNSRDIFIALGLGILLILSVFLINPKKVIQQTTLKSVQASVIVAPTSVPVVPKPDPYKYIDVSAKSIYIYDASTGDVLYSRDEDTARPLASLTKIMTAIVATDIMPQSTIITLHPEFLKVDGDNGLLVDEHWSFRDLLNFTLIVSSNKGAEAIASVAGALEASTTSYDLGREEFVRLMNERAHILGLSHTRFINPTGLDENLNLSGAYGSARDVAMLMSYAISKYPTTFSSTRYPLRTYTSLDKIAHVAKNTNEAAVSIPNLLASKTGYTDLAGGNVVIAFNAGTKHRVIISILGSTYQGRFSDLNTLVHATLKAIEE